MVSSLFADNWAESVIVDCPRVVTSQHPVSEVLDWFNRPASPGAIAPPGCVLVIDDSELRGIVTATDILRSLAAGRSLDGMAIAEVMTAPVIAIQRDQLSEPAIALNRLQQHGIHYLVVVDANASVVGVISSDHLNQILWQRLQQSPSLFQSASPAASSAPVASSAPAAPAAPALTSQQWQEKELPLLYRITQDISQAPDLNTALVATLRHICEDTGWVYGEVWMPSPEGTSLHCDTANYCADPQFLPFRQASRNLQFLPNQGLPGRVWTTQQAEWLQDVSQEDIEHFLRVQAAQECGLKAGFGVPILSHQQSHQQTNQHSQQQVVAVLDFFSADARQPDPALLTLMNSVAAQLGQMIERKLWEEALIRSEATHRALISALPDLVVRMSGDGIYLDAASNPSFDTYCGDRNLIGKRAHEALPADVADLRIEHIQQALATGTVQVYEQQFLDEGDLRIEEVRIVVCGDNEVLVIARDITERKQTEAALRHSEATNRAIINAIPDLLIRVNRQGEYLEMLSGGSVLTILLPEPSPHPNTVHDVLPPHLAELRAHAVQQAFVTRSLQVYEQLIDLSGEARWEEVRVMPLGEEEVLVMIRDISERKWAEETVLRSEAKKRAILSAIPDLMFQVSAEGVYLDYITTERAIDIVPTTINSIGLKMSDVLPPEVAQRQQAAIQRALASQQLQVYEQQFEMGDRIQYEEVRVVPAEDNTVLFMIRDISDRKRAELALYRLNQELEARIEQRTAELRASEERWHLALQGSNAALWDWNLRTNEIFRSARWHQLRGLSPNEVTVEPREWSERIHPEDRDRVSAAFADHLAQKTPFYQEEYRIQRKDGTYIWILDRGQALWDETGNPVRMTGSEMDISRRKQVELEAQILRERLQFVLSSSPAVIFTCAIDGAHEPTFISDNIFNLIGYTSEEFLRDPSLWMTHIHPQDAPRVFAEMPTLFEQGTHVCEYRLRHRDGHYCWVRNELKLVFDQWGDPVEIVGYLADINDRKQLELALQASQSKLSNVLNSANAGIIGSRLYRDRKFEYDFCSQGCETVFGYSQRELMGDKKLWISRVWPDDLPLITAWFNNILTGAEPISCDYRFFHQDGTLRWITSTYTAYWNDLEDCWIVTAVHVDITARKRTEEALAEKTETLDLFFNVSLDLLSITDSTGCFRRLNPQWETTLGYALEEVEGQPFLDFVHPDDFAATVAAASALAQQMPIVDFVNRYRCKDGSYRWIEWRSNPFGSFIYSAARDITERKQTEAILQQQEEELQCIVEELQVTEEELRSQMTELLVARDQIELERSRYQDLFDSAPDAYIVTNAEGWIQQANQMAEQLLGISRQALTGCQLLTFVKHDSLDLFQGYLQTLIRQAESQQFESELQRADGTTISAVMRVAVLSSPGSHTILRWIIRDISHEKQAEAQLQSLSERLSLAIRSGAIGIWEWDILQDTLLWDDRMYELYGVQRTDFEGAYQAWLSGLHPDDRPLADAAIQHALTGQHEFDIEFRVIHPNGAIRFIKAYGMVQRNPEGTPQRMIGINFDITERKQVEVQLQQINNRLTLTNAELDRATRLKDEFLANMSHELRTPLNAILGMSEGLKEGVFEPISDRQRHAIDTIERSGQHLLELINDILDLSKIEAGKLELQKSPVLVSYLCDSSLSFIRQQALQKSIHLVADIPKGMPDILIDERRIRQVLINLLSNAIKFTPEGGRIQLIARIATEVTTEGDRRFLELSVVDTGIGIAPDDLSKLFQPFVQIDSSLSRQYTGTGLGLALVRRLAELHDGSIGVTSEIGQGSCFTLRLPYVSSIVTDVVQPRASEPSRMPSNNSRVLLIEDSIAAADQLARYLEEQGMEILVYGRGEGALEEVIRIQPGLVILDIQLPNLSGWDVLQQLKAHPDTQAIPVVMVSVVDERSRGLALGAADYLVKPITREQLRAVLGHLQHPSAAPAPAPSPAPTSAPRLSSGRNTPEILPLILLVEDNEMNIATISSYLGGLGYRLIYAKTGYEALTQLETQQPDLVLMDIQMPDMDGLEAMRQIRQNPAWANLPIVALTALTMPGDRDRCLEAGATSYLSKPIKLKLLKEQIWQLLNA